jgi:hypothetical protein
MNYRSLPTTIGRAKLQNAALLQRPLRIVSIEFGDGAGSEYEPTGLETALRRKVYDCAPSRIAEAGEAETWIEIEAVIPADVGGWYLREYLARDEEGHAIFIGNLPESFKPVGSSGAIKDIAFELLFDIQNADSVVLLVDPSQTIATIKRVSDMIATELAKLDHKQSVRAATTAHVSLNGLLTVDGIVLLAGDRVLVKNQNQPSQNGIYLASTGLWLRAADADQSAEVTSAMLVAVEQGATLADTRWQLTTDGAIVLGATPLVFQNVTFGFAPLHSPEFTGLPEAPTPAQFDSSERLSTTEFVKRSSGNYAGHLGLTGNTALTPAAIGTVVVVYGDFTVSLPAANASSDSGTINFRNTGFGVVNVVCAGDDLIYGGSGNLPSGIAMQPGATLELTSNGADGWLAAGSAQLQYSRVDGVTPPLFDNSKALATTEFVQRAVGNKNNCHWLHGSRALELTDFGGEFVVSEVAGSTLTLPAIGLVPLGASVRIVNLGSSDCTFAAAAGEYFVGAYDTSGTATSFTLSPNDEVSITQCAGAHWLVVGSGSFNGSHAYGTRTLSGGLIMQWGTVMGPANPPNDRWEFDIAFPRVFPNQCFGVVGSPGIAAVDLDLVDGGGGTYRSCRSDSGTSIPTSAGFEAVVHYTTGAADSRIFTWHALGR